MSCDSSHGPPSGAHCPTACGPGECQRTGRVRTLILAGAVLTVLGVLLWQGVTAGGNPDPTAPGLSPGAAVMNTGVLVFREGLEAVLVLAALTASLVRTGRGYARPVALGAGLSIAASVATWFIAVAVIDAIDAPALHVQAATGLLAIVVLLVIMNWFFHKLYWAGWICLHERRKQAIIRAPARSERAVFWGLVLLGLTAVYREGFEIVLFLQSLRLRAGESPVALGTAIGLGLTGIVAVLTFAAQRKLPYRRMLIATGVMLGGVLLVMVGESAQELQLAGWIGATPVALPLPAWVGTWFATFPNAEGLAAQGLAAALVVGSYCLAKGRRGGPDRPTPIVVSAPPQRA